MARFQSTRPRGARLDPDHVSSNRQKFQSTRPRGARRVAGESSDPTFEFQSTRPRGARPLTPHALVQALCFNPRARVGRDMLSKFW